jgi:hypothetical protein
VQWTIDIDPLTSYLKPSMQQDLEKVSSVLFQFCDALVFARFTKLQGGKKTSTLISVLGQFHRV